MDVALLQRRLSSAESTRRTSESERSAAMMRGWHRTATSSAASRAAAMRSEDVPAAACAALAALCRRSRSVFVGSSVEAHRASHQHTQPGVAAACAPRTLQDLLAQLQHVRVPAQLRRRLGAAPARLSCVTR
jgi:hypothetical protein